MKELPRQYKKEYLAGEPVDQRAIPGRVIAEMLDEIDQNKAVSGEYHCMEVRLREEKGRSWYAVHIGLDDGSVMRFTISGTERVDLVHVWQPEDGSWSEDW